ncbi:MAG: aminotransferase class V-fold PLP-dependent enzyme [Candidatus Eisenbacteria bacterium]
MGDKFLRARKLFPIAERLAYLNHAAVSPLSVRVRGAIRKQLDEQVEWGVLAEQRWVKRAEEARKHAAGLLKAKPSEISFVTNTSQGLNLFARGITWKRGDNVVLPRVEFPANVYPWLSLEDQGVRIKFVPEREGRIIVEDIERAIDRRTRVVAVSFVEFSSGYRNDLELIGKLCRKRGVYLVVDGIQGVGALDLDVRKCRIDALSAGGHKWLLSPQGSGIFYCSSRVVKKLKHPMPGWMSVVGWQNYYEFDYKLFPDSRRYESAQLNFLGITGLLESLKLVNSLGIHDVETRVIAVTDHLCDLLRSGGFRIYSPRESGEKSGIVSFYPRKHKAEAVHGRLLKRGFVTSARQGRIRVSPHLYNTFEEMEKLVRALP